MKTNPKCVSCGKSLMYEKGTPENYIKDNLCPDCYLIIIKLMKIICGHLENINEVKK